MSAESRPSILPIIAATNPRLRLRRDPGQTRNRLLNRLANQWHYRPPAATDSSPPSRLRATQPPCLPQDSLILANWPDYFKRIAKTARLADRAGMDEAVVKRSVRIAGHATSVSLEAAFWRALGEIARRRAVPLAQLLAEIDAARRGNLSSAIRLFVLESCRRGELGAEEG